MWLLCAQDDGSHIYSPYLANSSMCCTYHLPMTEMQWLAEVKWQFNFDQATFLIYIWITLWLHQMTFDKKEKRGKKTRSEYISVELESFPSLCLPWASIYCLIIQSENENWSLKHLYLNKERGADYECSKCNFYYTSIILLLITDSFSLCSSSKTRSHHHMHTGAKKELARLFEMKCLIYVIGGGGTSSC